MECRIYGRSTMKLTKYEHSCFVLEHNNEAVLFDPGSWSSNLVVPDNLIAIILTHEHDDHFDHHILHEIISKHPQAVVIAPHEMVKNLSEFKTIAVAAGDAHTIGSFHLAFFGGTHASIYRTMPSVANIGVLVNKTFYYPGDSFALPHLPVKTLALPVTAPWLKISEVIDFMLAVHPAFTFPLHDHIASAEGKALVDRMLSDFAKQQTIAYQRLHEPIILDE